MNSAISAEDYVLWAYRLLLGREPEAPEALSGAWSMADPGEILEQFLRSPEFIARRRAAPPPDTATEEDIHYCFRLLLGRPPTSAEWLDHSARAGKPLYNVVQQYVASREFAQRGMLNKSYLDQVTLLQLKHFSLFVSPDDLAIGSELRQYGIYKPHVTAAFDRYAKPGATVLDIGANIGYMTMYLAHMIGGRGRVIAIEPNPESVALLAASRQVNHFDQVVVLQGAAGHETGILALNAAGSNGTTGKLPADDPGAIVGSHTVGCFPLDWVLPQNARISLVNIDVEGAELPALTGMASTLDQHRPVIVSAFSPGVLQGRSANPSLEYLQFLIAKGYELYVIETGGAELYCGSDTSAVLAACRNSGIGCVDLLAMTSYRERP